jgi:hypothetical protein
MIARLAAPLMTLAACAALYWAYRALERPMGTIFSTLQGTMIWELRWIALGCAFVALLTIVERLATWIGAKRWKG